MQKKKIAVVMGGYSAESQVSLQSGDLVFKSLNKEKYDAYKVIILENEWYLLDDNQNKIPINRKDFSVKIGENSILKFDVCFNIVIGIPGEDGEMQAYWDKIGQKYTGCNAKLSALTFDKKATLEYLQKFEIPSAKRKSFTKDDVIDTKGIIKQFGLPLFVKPNASGSSLGVSKVHKQEEFQNALKQAFKEGDEIIIQSLLKGTEVTVGVNRYQGKAVVLAVTQIVSFNDFFDKDAKYEGQSKKITPARLDPQTFKKVQKMALHAYNALQMTAVSRSQFIVMNGIPYMIEMNTNPGLCPTSLLIDQLKYYGLSIEQFCELEIKKCFSRQTINVEVEEQIVIEKSQQENKKEVMIV